jgi:hypothetical protein
MDSSSFSKAIVTLAILVMLSMGSSNAQLSIDFYSKSCPHLLSTVKPVVQSAINKEARMGASILRLFFHDCFVNVIPLAISLSEVILFFFLRFCMHAILLFSSHILLREKKKNKTDPILEVTRIYIKS